jgi:hypothetical protein
VGRVAAVFQLLGSWGLLWPVPGGSSWCGMQLQFSGCVVGIEPGVPCGLDAGSEVAGRWWHF